MPNKLTIGIVVAAVAMAGLVAFSYMPKQSVSPEEKIENFHLQYSRQTLINGGEAGGLYTDKADILTIENNGSASYLATDSDGKQVSERKFNLTTDTLRSLEGLLSETGFMQIPQTDYNAGANVSTYTKYDLQVSLNGQDKRLDWVNQTSGGSVPAIILNVGSRLDQIIVNGTGNS